MCVCRLSHCDTGKTPRIKALSYLPRGISKNKESRGLRKRIVCCLTFSEGQAGVCFMPVAEQDEGPGRCGRWEVDHLHVAFQREVVTQVQQVLQLNCDTSLSRHFLKEYRHPERTEGGGGIVFHVLYYVYS